MLVHHVASVLHSASDQGESYYCGKHQQELIRVLLEILERIFIDNKSVCYLLSKERSDYVHRLTYHCKAQRKNIDCPAAFHVLPQPSEKKHIISPSFSPGFVYMGGLKTFTVSISEILKK